MNSEQVTRLSNLIQYDADTFARAASAWGRESQMLMAVEECAELINAIAKLDRARATDTNVAEEAADVMIMVLQIADMCGADEFIEHFSAKVMRLRKMLP